MTGPVPETWGELFRLIRRDPVRRRNAALLVAALLACLVICAWSTVALAVLVLS
jgi:hypothetical protein